jgi:cytochrome c peroxidase
MVRVLYALGIVFLVAALAAAAVGLFDRWNTHRWSDPLAATLQSLSLSSLPPLPPDPSNAYASDPRAAALGHALFFDPRFSANERVSCATCHQPGRAFSDGLPRAVGVGTARRSAMPLIGAAYNPWFNADGRADSLWAQALGPLEDINEHGGTRTQYAHLIAAHYREDYEAIFGPLPDLSGLPASAGPLPGEAGTAWDSMSLEQQDAVTRVYVNMAKAIAAYQSRLLPGPSRFDAYAAAQQAGDYAQMRALFNRDEAAGLRLFIGKARCIECHNGPMLTNNDFQNVGSPFAPGIDLDTGRLDGVELVLASPFNCMGSYSDADPEQCLELKFARSGNDELEGAFRTPSLRNIALTAPYLHAGQFATLHEVIEHYNNPPRSAVGHNHLTPLDLSDREMAQLEAFLRTLDSPPAVEPEWLQAPSLP